MKKRNLEIRDIENLKFVGLPDADSINNKVYYPVKEVINKDDKLSYKSNIWCYDISKNKFQQFTNSKSSALKPKVSPNGEYLAFVSSGESCPLSLINSSGGESFPAWDSENKYNGHKYSISSLAWSPDSKYIALSMKKSKTKEEISDQRYYYIENLHYKSDGAGVFISENKYEIWIYDVEKNKLRNLFADKFNNFNPVWSPDGKKLLITSNKLKNTDFNLQNSDFYLINISSGKIKKITNEYGAKSSPSFSPDGKYIAYIGNAGKKNEIKFKNLHLRLLKVNGNGKSLDLLDKHSYLLALDYVIGDMKGLSDIDPTPVWYDEKTLYFTASFKGSCNLYKKCLKTKKVTQIEKNNFEIASFQKKGNLCVSLIADAITPPEIYSFDGKKFNKLTSHNSFLDKCSLSSPEVHFIRTDDDTVVQGWVIKPANFDKNKKYPAVMEIHGGPHVLYGWSFFFEFQLLSSFGYVVFYINPRGSQGYGEKFNNSIIGSWGDLDWNDIEKSAEYFMKLDFIDETKTGVTGGSYGGYMTNWAIGHTDIFAAAVTQRCVSNCQNFFGTSDAGFYFIDEVAKGKPWDKPLNYLKVSPISYVKNVKTPVLIIHSEGDQRTPIEQGEQFYVALKLLRKTCAFLRVKGESHGMSRTGHPKNRMIRLAHIIMWFDKFLKDKDSRHNTSKKVKKLLSEI